jgi:hypothetical protein
MTSGDHIKVVREQENFEAPDAAEGEQRIEGAYRQTD